MYRDVPVRVISVYTCHCLVCVNMGIDNFKCEFALSLTSLLKKHCNSKDTYNEIKQYINETSGILTFIEKDINEGM